MTLEITPMLVPAHADAAESQEFRAMISLGNRLAAEDTGITDLDETAAQNLPAWHEQRDRIRRGFIARRGGEIVGAGTLITSAGDHVTSAELELKVPSSAVDDGTGQELLTRLEHEARAMGRSILQLWTLHPADSGPDALVPRTGHGAITPTRLSALVDANGYTLEQVERNSVLPLNAPVEPIENALAEAAAIAGPDYRVETWTLPTPPALRAGYAGVIARMSTDVPSGELTFERETWDEERIVRRDAGFVTGGQTMSVAAVVHEPTGEMVAFNELLIGADPRGITHQWGTLVVESHRGRRLGTIVKCTNLLRWRGIAPQSPRVSTFNAEENRAMLDINEAIGFVPASYAGAWQKKLR